MSQKPTRTPKDARRHYKLITKLASCCTGGLIRARRCTPSDSPSADSLAKRINAARLIPRGDARGASGRVRMCLGGGGEASPRVRFLSPPPAGDGHCCTATATSSLRAFGAPVSNSRGRRPGKCASRRARMARRARIAPGAGAGAAAGLCRKRVRRDSAVAASS